MTQHGQENETWLQEQGFAYDPKRSYGYTRCWVHKTLPIMVSFEMVEYSYHEPFKMQVNKLIKNALKKI